MTLVVSLDLAKTGKASFMLGYYHSIDEKRDSQLFDYYRVEQFSQLLEKVNSEQFQNFCFRGQRDALWKIHSTAQRVWSEWGSRKHCLDKKIFYWLWLARMPIWAREHSHVLPEYVQQHLEQIGDHEILGYLQHFCFPTTLVDFTPDFATALFMAVHDINLRDKQGYFSIYGFNQKTTLDKNESYGLEEIVKKWGEDHPSMADVHLYDYKVWMPTKGVLIRKDSQDWCPEISAGRMASQNGMFVHWPSERMPLETLFAEKYKLDNGIPIDPDWDVDEELAKKLAEVSPDWRAYKAVEAERLFDRMVCIDVPYSCASDVKQYCKQMGKTEESLGLADKQAEDRLKELLKQYLESWVSESFEGKIP